MVDAVLARIPDRPKSSPSKGMASSAAMVPVESQESAASAADAKAFSAKYIHIFFYVSSVTEIYICDCSLCMFFFFCTFLVIFLCALFNVFLQFFLLHFAVCTPKFSTEKISTEKISTKKN